MIDIDFIFNPRSVAVIGASDTPGKWGYMSIKRPLSAKYPGPIYPINTKCSEIMGLPAYPTVSDVPGDIDIAVIATPAKTLPNILRQCIKKGILGAVIISAGFAESGTPGRLLEDEIRSIAVEGGIRIVGPNCMGLWSAAGQLNLSFEKIPKTGAMAFISQSGTFGIAMARVASQDGYGLSKFVSIGNQADLEAADYIEYLAQDKYTRVIMCYLEGLKNGRRFFDVARRVTTKKPIVVYKAGTSKAGSMAAMSHTASIAGSEKVFDGMCKQAGIIRVYEAFHLFEVAEALAHSPLPVGNRIAILGSGGQGVVGSDACSAFGLELPPLDPDTAHMLSITFLPQHAPKPANPIDFAGSRRAALHEANVIEQLLKLDYIDGVISNVPISPQIWNPLMEVDINSNSLEEPLKSSINGARRYAMLPKIYGKPVICLRFDRLKNDFMEEILREGNIPIYDTPEQCARAMSVLYKYSRVLSKDRIKIE